MKKIYLFSIALLALIGGAVAQPSTNPADCPGVSGPIWRTQSTFPTNFCTVVFTTNTSIDEFWYISLIDFNGNYIPLYGTGPGTANPAQRYLQVNPATKTAAFHYDCDNPGFTQVKTILVEHIIADQIFTTCSWPVLEQIVTPVKLTSFNGRLQTDNSVSLDWTSSLELDSYKYEVERSADGKYFEKVGHLNAAGNSSTSLRYTFNDQLPGAGAYFYRLKQIDFNGAFEYSKVVYVNSKKGAGTITKVFPNPFQNTIQLVGATSADLTPANVQVSTIAGQRINFKVIGNSISIDPSAPAGLYLVKVKGQVFKLEKAPSRGF